MRGTPGTQGAAYIPASRALINKAVYAARVAEAEAGAPGSGSGSGNEKINGSGSGSGKKKSMEAEAEAIKKLPLPDTLLTIHCPLRY